MSGAGSGMCELTNQSIQDGGLKETGARIGVFQSEGGHSDAELDSLRKLLCFLRIKACKPILLVTQIKS